MPDPGQNPHSLPLPPLASGLPILGSAFEMADNPLRYFLRLYRKYGPIFRIRVLHRTYTVMAGLEANRFLISGNDCFSSYDTFVGMGHELGTDRLLLGMDGAEHLTRRKLQRHSYSRESMLPHLPELIQMANRAFERWQPGQCILILPELQRIIVQQLGLILTHRVADDYFDDIRAFMHMNVYVNAAKLLPTVLLRYPPYQRAKVCLMQLGHEIVAEHRTTAGRAPDLVDDLLAERDEHGEPLSEQAVIAETIGSFNAGLDTVAGTCAFMLYAVLKVPGLLERLQAEVDSAFAGGHIDLNMLKSMPVLHAVAMETLRLYPVAPFVPRNAAKAFEFAGYRVDSGARLFVAPALTHFMAECFPDPDQFDVDRYSDDVYKSRPANAFAPFMLGAHTCLGAGIAETQIMLLIGLLIYSVDLRLDPLDYEAKMRFTPIPNPGNKLAARVISRRHKTLIYT
jgi:cytochrome P450